MACLSSYGKCLRDKLEPTPRFTCVIFLAVLYRYAVSDLRHGVAKPLNTEPSTAPCESYFALCSALIRSRADWIMIPEYRLDCTFIVATERDSRVECLCGQRRGCARTWHSYHGAEINTNPSQRIHSPLRISTLIAVVQLREVSPKECRIAVIDDRLPHLSQQVE